MSSRSALDTVDRRIFRFGEFELHMAQLELRRRGAVVPLQPTPFRLLLYLLENHDRVVSTQELLEVIWGETAVTPGSITTALYEIRRALEDDGVEQRWVRTRRRCGYSLTCAVTISMPPTLRALDDADPRSREHGGTASRALPSSRHGQVVGGATLEPVTSTG